MKQPKPVAVFDSGLGGISVLQELIRLMPQENYLYFGDSLNAPYGIKSTDEVLALTLKNIDFLLSRQAKAIVLACNTATSAAVTVLREKYHQIPLIGMEPALKPAINKLHGRIVVMATEVTLREQKFATLLDRYRAEAEIISLPASGIVNFVEQGITQGPELEAYLNEIMAPFHTPKVSGIVLGCTHFPFVKDSITKALGYEVEFFDGAEGTAKETQRQLHNNGLETDSTQPGNITFFNSNDNPKILSLCQQLLNSKKQQVL